MLHCSRWRSRPASLCNSSEMTNFVCPRRSANQDVGLNTRSRSLDYYPHRNARPAPAEAEEIAALEEQDPAVAWERACAVRAALAHLPDPQREVIYLHRFEQMTFSEIAAVLDTSEGAVKLRAFRGYEKLREELAPLLEEDHAA